MDKAPDAFRTISEVAEELDIPQHVLRFWETRFTQIKPMKRSGGRRFYRPDDVDLLRGIRKLLYSDGYTIRGVQRILKEQGVKAVQHLDAAPEIAETTSEPIVPVPAAASKRTADKRASKAKATAPEPQHGPESDEGSAEEGSIVVTPPLPKPFTTPLPSLELRVNSVQTVGMVPRSAIPQSPGPVLPKMPPSAPQPHYLPDITFETLVPRTMRVAAPEALAPIETEPRIEPAEAEAAPSNPVPQAHPAAPEAKHLKPILNELMAIRRLLDTAMQNGDPA